MNWRAFLFGMLGAFGTIGSLTSAPAHAGDFSPRTYGVEVSADQIEHFQVEKSFPAKDLLQVTWWHLEERTLAPDTMSPVLFGRDLDGDGRPDAWFYRDASGMLTAEDHPSRYADGHDVALDLISRQLQISDRWLIAVSLNAIFSKLSFTVDQMNRMQETVLNDELDIKTFEVQTNRLQKQNPSDPSLPVYRTLISRAYRDLADRLSSEEMHRLYASLAGDAALLLITGGMGKLLVRAEAWAMSKLGASAAAQVAEDAFVRYSAAITEKAAALGSRTALDALTKAQVQLLARMAPLDAVRVAISGTLSRSRFGAAAGTVLSKAAGVARAGVSQWKYVALTQSLQVGAEILSRGRAVYDPNPIVLTENLAQNPDFVQNFAYMTNETFWMAGLSTYFQTPGKRLVSCALFSLVDSTFMNYAVRGSVDPERQAFDTGWEVVVGNAQTQMDLLSLRTIEASIQRSRNPNLRLVGYMVVVLDQGAGYYGYSRASMEVEDTGNMENGRPIAMTSVETRIVPVMAPL